MKDMNSLKIVKPCRQLQKKKPLSPMCQFAWAASNVLPHSPGGQNSEIKASSGLAPFWGYENESIHALSP